MIHILDETKITENYEKFRKLINQTFTGERLESLNKMYDHLEDRIILTPASSTEHFHNAFAGGYLDHVLRVTRNAVKVFDLHTELGIGDGGYDRETVIFTALHHDLGKVGNDTDSWYIPNDSQWHIENQGKIYNVNADLEHMDVTDRSFFLLQQYGIKYSTREFYGIRLADGMYVKANEAYLKTSMPNMMLRTHIPIIVHQADMMATYLERDMWKNGNKKEAKKVEKSVNKIKDAVDTEVKEKFTKSTDPKDIFNELFGEKK